MKNSFSLIELIFVIVIIGILAGVALPKLFSGVDDALYSKAQTQIATIRAGISSSYSKNIMSGEGDSCPELEKDTDDGYVFENVLAQPLKENSGNVKWKYESNSSTETNYTLTIDNKSSKFVYEKNSSQNCPFKCYSGDLCNKLK